MRKRIVLVRAPRGVIRLWLDHPALGCGERQMLVLTDGRKWVRLLCIATMTAVSVPKTGDKAVSFDGAVFVKTSRTRLQRRLRANAATFGASKNLLRTAIAAAARI